MSDTTATTTAVTLDTSAKPREEVEEVMKEEAKPEEAVEEKWDERTRFLFGDENVDKLQKTCVAVIGVGGVGGYCVEALSRVGIGKFVLVDGDALSMTNLNRHILGRLCDVGKPKVDLARERILSFNPSAEVISKPVFFTKKDDLTFFPPDVDFIVDACDMADVKVHLAELCIKADKPFIMALGAARRLDPTKIVITSLDQTSGDPLAAILRKNLKKRIGEENLWKVTVSMSTEPPIQVPQSCKVPNKRAILPSFVTVPGAAGLAIGNYVIQALISGAKPKPPKKKKQKKSSEKSSEAKEKHIN